MRIPDERLEFQSLQGTIQTRSSNRDRRAAGGVSIPSRYDPNQGRKHRNKCLQSQFQSLQGTIQTFSVVSGLRFQSLVSIPSRYDPNSKEVPCFPPPQNLFQSLQGTIQTRGHIGGEIHSESMFQSLQGTIQTSLKSCTLFIPSTSFNPFKVRSKPSRPSRRGRRRALVSIPSRYDPNRRSLPPC